MIINELRFASGYVDSEGTSHGFDDLGCLARYSEAGRWPDAAPTLWVMDYNRRDWRRAVDAWFVRSDSLLTPMGYGIVALGDSLEASRLAVHGADVFRYDALGEIANERQGSATQAAPTIKE
jgi:copper chaperone NosL